MRKYLAGSMPGADKLVLIARANQITIEWLATGEGPMRRGHHHVGEELVGDYVAIPLYEVRAAAGAGALVEHENVVDVLHFKESWVRQELRASPSDLYLIHVDGESMEPTLRPGDVILVDRRDTGPARDGIYVLRMDGALLVKRLQRLPGGNLKVSSDNPAYEPFVAKASDLHSEEFVVVGRVVWSGRRL